MKVTIKYNSLGDCDWFEIYRDDVLLQSGHRLEVHQVAELLQAVQGYTKVEYVAVAEFD